mgnify:CR=1 FL=1
MGYLADTDVLIEISKGNYNAIDFFDTLGEIKISVISAMELLVGARNKKEIKAKIDDLKKSKADRLFLEDLHNTMGDFKAWVKV